MANIKSAIKRIRSSARKQKHNRIVRGKARTAVKNAHAALSSRKADGAQASVQEAISALDHAAGKGVIHKNSAARRKSRLMKQLNQVQQPR